MDDLRELFELTAAIAADFYETLPDHPIYPRATVAELHAALSAPLPEHGLPARPVFAELAAAADPGIVAEASGRYFGFVVGGAVPASIAADWLTSTWDQNAGIFVLGPSASIVEQAAGAWLIELLGLPRPVSFGFVTGAQMASFTALAAARHHVLAQAGWDVEGDGLQGAPKIRVVVGAKCHGTIDRALRMLGLGAPTDVVSSDAEGRMLASELQIGDVMGAEVLNSVELNQVLFRFPDDTRTEAVLAGMQASGEAWMSGTVWDERPAIRISVSNWQTSEDDVERTLSAFRALAPA
jgi:glutamate/tyrosine decarboxylase-like PLP-dependent enzyme